MIEILYVGTAHAIFVALFLWSKENKTLSEKLLSVWMLFLALPMISRALSPDILDLSIPVLSLNLAYPLTFGPFLWLYAESLVGDRQKLRAVDLIHFAPFALAVLYRLTSTDPSSFPQSGVPLHPSLMKSMIGWGNVLSLICYSGAVIWRLRMHYREVFNHFSELSMNVTLKWLTWVTVWFVLAYSLPLIDSLITLPFFFGVHGFAFTSFIFILSFYGLKQTQMYEYLLENNVTSDDMEHKAQVKGEEPELKSDTKLSKNTELKAKYERSGLSEERDLKYLNRLEGYMKQERPYLDAGLTIEKLAKALSIPRHYLTQVISEQLDKNFYLFINEYRIHAVKRLLKDTENQHLTLLDIALRCGFNSKSTFNTVFKKMTEMTPSQYKKTKVRD